MRPEEHAAYDNLSQLIKDYAHGTVADQLIIDETLRKRPPLIGVSKDKKRFYFSDQYLSALPPEIGQLQGVEVLYLQRNNLSALSPEIGSLESLKKLYLSINHLRELPPEIGALPRLTHLFVHDNELTTLPPEIGNLVSLRILRLEDNSLSMLPLELRNLSTLIGLYLHGNASLNIPEEHLGPKWDPALPRKILNFYFSSSCVASDEKRPSPQAAGEMSREAPASADPEVYVSYNTRTPESVAFVNRLQEAFRGQGIRLLRDSEDVRYKDSFRDFMRRLGRGKCVVVVISDAYLKSENCMFEMVEMAAEDMRAFRDRIFPIVLPDATIDKATGRVDYVSHWEAEFNALDKKLKTIRGDNVKELQEDLNLYSKIRGLTDSITGTLGDMNALSPQAHEDSGFESLLQRIRERLQK